MDESLAQVAIDLSGRPAFVYNVPITGGLIGSFAFELVEEFFKSLSTNGKFNLHIHVPYGTNKHHIAEAMFRLPPGASRSGQHLSAQRGCAEYQGFACGVMGITSLPDLFAPIDWPGLDRRWRRAFS